MMSEMNEMLFPPFYLDLCVIDCIQYLPVFSSIVLDEMSIQ
jgi:hypothetical protein